MDETKLLNYLKGESDAEECLEVEAWYHASAEHKKQLEGPDKAQRVREKISA